MHGPQAPIEAAGASVRAEDHGQSLTSGFPAPAPPSELKESSRQAPAVDVAELGFYETAEADRLTFVDANIRDLFGVPPDDGRLPRDRCVERVHPADRDRVRDVSRAMRSEGRDRVTVQYRYLHPDRGLLWLDHRCWVLARDASGNVLRTIGIVEDITDRKLNEEVLRDLAGRYDTLTSTTRDGFWELDGEGRILAANDEACLMYGYDL